MRLKMPLGGLELYAVFAALLSGLSIAYLFTPSYMDYSLIEPGMAVGSQQWLHGRPLYTTTSGPGYYDTLYAPAAYLYTAFGMVLFQDPIFGSKFSSVVLCCASLGLFLWAARRSLSWSGALFALGLFAVQSLFLPEYCFGIAVNPGLTFAVVLGLFSCTFATWNVRVGLLAFATGLAMCTKLHGPIYLLPAWIFLLREGGWFRSLWCGLISLEVFLLPFFLPGISLRNHLDLLLMSGRHPRQWEFVNDTLFMEFLLAWPILILLIAPTDSGFWALRGRVRQLAFGLLLGFLLVLIPASKAGAGPHHLWPFIPWIGYGLALWLQSAESQPVSVVRWRVVVAFLMAWMLIQAFEACHEMRGVLYFLQGAPARALVESDLKDILRRYPEAPLQMGYGADRGYTLTYFRPLLYQRPTPCLVDGNGAMDFVEAGVSLEPALKAMLERHDDLWLIPKDETPFTMSTWYEPKRRLFDQAFTDEFLLHFHKVSSSSYFDIYAYRSK